MSEKTPRFSKVRIKGKDSANTLDGEIRNDKTNKRIKVYHDTDGTDTAGEYELVSTSQTQTLTNKTTTDQVIDGDVTGTAIDTDVALTANSDTKIASQKAVKAYVDSVAAGQDDASEINYDNTTSGLTATDVQAAIDEVEGRLDTAETGLSDHLADTVDAHDASAISNVPSGNLVATDVQGALNELQTEMDGRPTVSETMQNKTLDSTNTFSGSIETPTRSDVKQDTEANLTTYATTASDGQIVFATDTQKMYQIISNSLEAIGGGGSTSFEISQTSHGFAVGDGIYHNGTNYVKGQADAEATLAYHVVIEVPDANTFLAADFGRIEATAHGFTVGQYYFLSEASAGTPTTTEPSTGFSNPLFYVEDANTLQIKCLRPSPVGDSIALDELSDVSVPSPTDGQALIYNNSNSRWEASNIATAASDITYSNATSGLTATDAQAAIDEVEGRVDTAESDITSLQESKTLDTFYSENFERNIGAADFTSGNDATFDNGGTLDGTLADETTTQLSGTSSLSYTMGSTSTNDFIKSPAITIEEKQQNQTVGLTFYYTYNGDDDDIKVVAYDNTNSEVLTTSVDFLKASTTSQRFSIQFPIPDTCASLSWGIQVVTGNNTKELVIDDVEISTNPFVYKNLTNDTDWVNDGTVTIDATTTAPSKGSGVVTDNVWWRRSGSDAEVRIEFRKNSNTGATSGSGDYLFKMPAGLKIDTTKVTAYSTIEGLGSWIADNTVGKSSAYTGAYVSGDVIVYDEDYVRFGAHSSTTDGFISSAYGDMINNANTHYLATFKVPIQEWQAESEHVIAYNSRNAANLVVEGAGNGGTSLTANVTDIDFTEVVDTGYGNSNWNGTQFTVPENGLYHISGVVLFSTSAASTLNYYINGTVEKNLVQVATNQASFSISLNLNKDEVFSIRNNTSKTLTNDTTGHWIKISKIGVGDLLGVPTPLTCYIKDVKSSGTDGGSASTDTVHTRTLNTLEGDTSFVSLSGGTTGTDGTATQFTLQPGKYEIEGAAPRNQTDGHQLFLYNTTDSNYDIEGGFLSDGNSGTNRSTFQGTIELTEPKTFEIRHYTQTALATTGLGRKPAGASNPASVAIYTQVKITKVR